MIGFASLQEQHMEVDESPLKPVLYTGGAMGIDTMVEELGKQRGMKVHVMITPNHPRAVTYTKPGAYIPPFNSHQIELALPHVYKANQTLKRNISEVLKSGLLQRNYWIIRDADRLFAFGEFDKNHMKKDPYYSTLKGGTGWTVQMALDLGNKVVFVYDKNSQQWYQPTYHKDRDPQGQWYTYHKFIPCKPPNLGMTSNAIVGSREPTQNMIQELTSLFQRHTWYFY